MQEWMAPGIALAELVAVVENNWLVSEFQDGAKVPRC